MKVVTADRSQFSCGKIPHKSESGSIFNQTHNPDSQKDTEYKPTKTEPEKTSKEESAVNKSQLKKQSNAGIINMCMKILCSHIDYPLHCTGILSEADYAFVCDVVLLYPEIVLGRTTNGILIFVALLCRMEALTDCSRALLKSSDFVTKLKQNSVVEEVAIILIRRNRVDLCALLGSHKLSTFAKLVHTDSLLLSELTGSKSIFDCVRQLGVTITDVVDANGFTLLHHFVTTRVQNPWLDLLHIHDYLSDRGDGLADQPAYTNGWTAMHYAAHFGRADLVRSVAQLSGGKSGTTVASLHTPAFDNSTPLHLACLAALRGNGEAALRAIDALLALGAEAAAGPMDHVIGNAGDTIGDLETPEVTIRDLCSRDPGLAEVFERHAATRAAEAAQAGAAAAFMRWLGQPMGQRLLNRRLQANDSWREMCRRLQLDADQFERRVKPAMSLILHCKQRNMMSTLIGLLPKELRQKLYTSYQESIR